MSIRARALHGINVCILPDEFNDYRPYALRHKSLAALSALLLATKIIAALVISLTPSQAELSTITVDRITQLTNQERVKAGLKPLTTNSKLAAAAQQKGLDMLEGDYFAHISPSGVTPWYWMNKNGYTYQVAGENLAVDFTEAEDTVAAWMASPSHKANILQPAYTETGVAVVRGEFQGGTSTIVVHMFGKPSGGKVAAEIVQASPKPSLAPAPTEIPSPSSTPVTTPSPSPVLEPLSLDTTPPKAPQIALLDQQSSSVKDEVQLVLTGESFSQTYVLMGEKILGSFNIPFEGSMNVTVPLDEDIPEGPISLTAYSVDRNNNKSENSSVLTVTKDTTGPAVLNTNLYFVIPPTFDSSTVSFQLPEGDYTSAFINDTPVTPTNSGGWMVVPLVNNVSLSFVDSSQNKTIIPPLSLTPSFKQTGEPYEQQVPSALRSLTRRLALMIILSLTILLSLSVLIRIQVQRPTLIAHTTAVIFLAALIFWL